MPEGTTETSADEENDAITLPTQSHGEVARELQDWEQADVKRLARAVLPGDGDFHESGPNVTEVTSHMDDVTRQAFTNEGLDAAIEAANEVRPLDTIWPESNGGA